MKNILFVGKPSKKIPLNIPYFLNQTWIMKSVVYKSLEKILKDLLSSSFFSEWYTIPFQNLSNVND